MKSPSAIRRTIRNIRRAREILGVLIGYGFDNIIQELNLDRLLQKGRRIFSRSVPNEEIERLPIEVRLRKALEDLGPLFIKLGQILSVRPDLVPEAWADEFRKLQDEVGPVSYDRIKLRLEQEFPGKVDKIFRKIDPAPLAAASIAQVHRAELHDGTKVVLKILRPDVESIIESDLQILAWLAEFAEERFADLGYSPVKVVEQFSDELKREIDMRQEGRATDRLRRAFEENENVSFPRVYWQASTQHVLALEEIHGTSLSKVKKQELSPETRRNIVKYGTDAVFRQCFEIGFFHADPHPGNLFLLEDGTLCFIDCGMTGHIDPRTAGQLSDLIRAVVDQDLDQVVRIVIALADADPSISDDRSFRADAWEFIARFDDVSLKNLHMGNLLQDFFDRLRKHKIRCPSDIVFLIKAITTIEGVGEWLDPEFDVVEHVNPYLNSLVRDRYGFTALRKRVQNSLIGYSQFLEELPDQARSMLLNLRKNRVTVNLEHRGLENLRNTIDHASDTIAHSVFVGSLILGSAVLLLADSVAGERGLMSIFAAFGFAIAIFMIVARTVKEKFRS